MPTDNQIPNSSFDVREASGKIKMKVDPEGALRVYAYKNVKVDLEADATEFPEEFWSKNNPDIVEYYPVISVEFICPKTGEEIGLKLKNEDITELTEKDRHKWTDLLEVFCDGGLEGEPGEYSFKELFMETGYGKYRGYMEIDFEGLQTIEELKDSVEEELRLNYEWYDDPCDIDNETYVGLQDDDE